MYNSGRVDGSFYPTDAISVSFLSQQELYDFDYSDTMANFKLTHILNENATKKSIRSKHVKRLVYECDQNTYKSSEDVKFLNIPLQEMLNGIRL